ncbi:MAG: hypothetical protein FWF14_03475 [Streptococcaceae bacterium]|nr:hypothetical protein [Streptococcaceae bacterium]
MKSRKNYDLIDFIKVVLALSIVGIHMNVPLLNWIGRIGVPFFFSASGFFFFKKYDKEDSLGQIQLLKNYCLRIFRLWIFWIIVNSPWLLLDVWHSHFKMILLIGFWLKLILFGWIEVFPIGWFLIASIFGMIIVTQLLKCVELKYIILLGLIIEVGLIIYNPILDAGLSLGSSETALRTILYLALGCMFARYEMKIKIPHARPLFFILLFLNFIEFSLFNEKIVNLSLIGLVIVLFYLAMKSGFSMQNATNMRKLSTYIYPAQSIAIQLSVWVMSHLIHKPIDFMMSGLFIIFSSFILTIVLIFVSYSLIRRMMKVSRLEWLKYSM